MQRFIRYIPALASFLVGGGLEVSGIEIPWLGYSLMILGVILFLIPTWPTIRRIKNRKQRAESLTITMHEVRLVPGSDKSTQVFVSLTFKTPTTISIGKLDLIFEDISYQSVEPPLPRMIQGTESLRFKYIIPKFRPEISMPYLLAEEHGEEASPAHFSILAGSIVGDTESFPIITTQAWSESHKEGLRIL